ncbi:hypothetical protein [Paracoccus sp. KR1-242]|uniref:hypothetical protein n=1 Tax=Paracoccus sp. KR1-242 TaxID=3410028 RepID=UPI003BFC4589
MKRYDEYDEDELRELLIDQYQRDCSYLHSQGVIPLPWAGGEFAIAKDHYAILIAVMDSAGNFPNSSAAIQELLGFKATGNATASLNGAIRANLIAKDGDYLCMTEYGRHMIEFAEDNPDALAFSWD